MTRPRLLFQANVMVEYPYQEALELLEQNVATAKERLVRAPAWSNDLIPSY
jgi:hypothetical protein